MIHIGDRYFACDECPISEGIEHRLRTSREYGHEFQYDHCGCDKVQTDFFISGYCGDAFAELDEEEENRNPRKTGRAYRRKMYRHKKDRRMEIMKYGYWPSTGWTDWGYEDGVYQPVGTHIRYPKNSNRQKYWKGYSNRKVRRQKGTFRKGNSYRRSFDYRWTID